MSVSVATGTTPSSDTGPSAGVDGSGSYYFAEVSSPRVPGDVFTLAYDGSACSSLGLLISTVAFHYHMYGSNTGELRLASTAAAGQGVGGFDEPGAASIFPPTPVGDRRIRRTRRGAGC